MNCKGLSSLLSPYLDGELSGREMRLVREHLGRCDSCLRELEAIRAIKAAVCSMPEPDLPPGFEERLVATVMHRQATRVSFGRLAFFGSVAFASAFALATFALQTNRDQSVNSQVQAAKTRFELERDQAYLAGGDPLAGSSVVLTSSHGLR